MKKGMSSYRKFLAASISATLVATVAAPFVPVNVLTTDAATIAFTDVKDGVYYAEPINFLAEKGVLQGYNDGTFKPGNDITRAEAAKIIATILGLDVSISSSTFPDVKAGQWFTPFITAVKNAGIVTGYEDGTFKPNEKITRAEMAKMLVSGYEKLADGNADNLTFSDVKKDSWYAASVAALVDNEITTGTTATTFSPNANVTRGQVATFVYRAETMVNLQAVAVVSDTEVTLDGKTYSIGEDVKGIFNESNGEVLTGAKAAVEVKDGEIVKVTQLVLTASGQDTEESFDNNVVFDGNNATISGDVRIKGDYLTLKNVTVAGNLYIDEEAGNVFYANGVTVEGDTIVSEEVVSAAQLSILNVKRNMIVFENSSLKSLNVKRSGANFDSRGTTKVSAVTVSKNITITASAGVEIGDVTVDEGAEEVTINANIQNLTINTTKEITVAGNGNIKSVSVERAAKITLNTTGKVESVQVKGDTKISVGAGASIGKLVLPKGKKVEDVVENYDQVKEKIETVTDEPAETETPTTPSPSPGSGGGSGGGNNNDTLTFSPTLYVTKSSGDPVQISNGSVSLDDDSNSVLIKGVKISNIPNDTNVKITSVKVRESIELVNVDNVVELTISNNEEVTTKEIFGALDTGTAGISLGNLRAFFLNEDLEIKFTLKKTGYTDKTVTATINLGSDNDAPTSISNQYVSFVKEGNNKATVTVLDDDVTFGELKVDVDTDLASLIGIFLLPDAEVDDIENLKSQIELLLDEEILDNVKISQLVGEVLTFEGYTVEFRQ